MNDELIAKTPIGEIVVGIKSDHDYPGIFVEPVSYTHLSVSLRLHPMTRLGSVL